MDLVSSQGAGQTRLGVDVGARHRAEAVRHPLRRGQGASRVGLAAIVSALLAHGSMAAPSASLGLPGDRLFPESVSATRDGTLYVGSFAAGGVLRIDPGAEAVPFIPPGAGGTRSILGVLVDEGSGMLWLCSNDLSGLGVKGPSDVEGAYLKGFDLKSARLEVSARFPGPKTFCNDIAIGPDGAAYVTNSAAPEVLRLPKGGDRLETFATDPRFAPPANGKGAGLDGIAFGGDGTLYVDTFTEPALFKVAIAGGKAGVVTKLETSQPLVLPDAIRPTDGGAAFLMVEGQGKLDRVTVTGDKARIDTLRTGLDAPTGVAQVGDIAWVSEGQLPALLGRTAPHLPFDLKAVRITVPAVPGTGANR